ncbi:MAG TPA: BTAD domain-containing putative transcriptional regulator, partial [Ornithinibacter sp.]|nr:BTAD domain-containing putative transcriptional regulator [Ornithinibacter sp.]
MRVGVLGPVVVDGDALALGPRDRVVLGVLVLRLGVPLRTDSLAEALWGETPPPSAAKVVQGCMLRLRRVLGPEAIETVPPGGYRLTLHHGDVDVTVFEDLVARARGLLAAGQPDRARYAVERALSLWRGDPFPELEHWEEATPSRERLCELRRDAEEVRAEAVLAVGGHPEVLADLQRLVAEEPNREHRWVLLALAEYRCGRQADALDTLRGARRHLGDELGLDPGDELVDLQRAVLSHDPALAAPPVEAAQAECPYPGLLYFDVGDAASFHGREAEVAVALRTIDRTHALVVVGPSGSGKSSLLRAGVAAALARDGSRVLVMTPGRQPRTAWAALGASPSTVVVVDQLEEALDPGTEDRDGFADDLARFVGDGGRLVLGVRGDRMGQLATHPALARLAETGLQLLGPMTSENLRRAVVGPAEQAGLRLEPGLVDLLVREVEGEPAALPLLSHVLRETWLVREGRTLTVAGYRSTGGVQAAVARTAETLFHDLDPEGRTLLRQLMTRLVATGEEGAPVRRRVPRRSVDQDHRHDLVERLIAARLVSSDGEVLEIAHESLTVAWPRLRSWLDDDVDGLRIMRHLAVAAENWDQLGRPDSELYRGGRVARAVDWRERVHPDLTAVETDFLEASVALSEGERRLAEQQVRRERRVNRRLRAGLGATVVLALVATTAGVLASAASRRADAAATASDARRLGAEALRAKDLDTALLLSVAGVRLDESPDTRANLLATLDRAPTLVRLARTPRVVSLALNPRSGLVLAQAPGEGLIVRRAGTLAPVAVHAELQGAGVFTAPDGSTAVVTPMPDLVESGAVPAVVVLDPDGTVADDQLGGIPEGRFAQQDAAIGPDSRWLAVTLPALEGDAAPLVGVWDLAAREAPVALLDLGDQSQRPVVASGGRSLWSSGGGVLRETELASGRVLRTLAPADLDLGVVDDAFALSPDGSMLAVAAGAQLAFVDTASGTVRHVVPVVGGVDRIGFSADGSKVASAGDTLMVWDIGGGEPVELLVQDDGGGWPVFDGSGRTLHTASFDGMLLAWDLSGERGFLPSVGGESTAGGGGLLKFSPDGRRVLRVSGGPEPTLTIRDVATGVESRAVDVRQDVAAWLDGAWSADGALVTVQTRDDVLAVWDSTTLEEVARRPLPAGEQVLYAEFTPQGVLLAGTTQGRVHVLDARTLEPRREPVAVAPALGDGPAGLVGVLHARPGTTEVLAGVEEAGLFLVDTVSGAVRPLELGVEGFGLAWSPDGDRLAVTTMDGAVGLRDVDDGRWVSPLSDRQPFAGWTPTFAADGSEWATAASGRVGRWDGRTGAFLGAVTLDSGAAVRYVPDRSVLLVAQDHGPVRRWDLDAASWVRTACAV